MKRRKFLHDASATAITGIAGLSAISSTANAQTPNAAQATGPASQSNATASGSPRKPVQMYVGCQRGPTTPQMLQYYKRHGVDHICAYPTDSGQRGYFTVEDLQRTRDLCEQHDITVDMIALPFLTSSHIDREKRGAIMLGSSPERDRDIEQINLITEACAKVGIPAWKYNMSLLGVPRIESTPGRGGSLYSTWNFAKAKANPPLTRAGRVTDDMAWERITYFLERVVPVCNQYKIRCACHPHDPGMPPEGYQGITNVLGTVDGMKKFVSIQESPYHGLNFCLGTIAEMLQNPNEEIHDIIRYFGQRQKIFNIHFRNIRGHRDDFQEVYLDNGDMDMLQVARTLHEVGYSHMVMPDHVPRHPDDPNSLQAFAFSYGYIKALLKSIDALG